MPNQNDLALKIGSSQQTVSRWEAGASRPRQSQIAILATAIDVDESALHNVAGYGTPSETLPAKTTVSFDQPFPVDALAPDSFERFVERLLHGLYPDAREIRRAWEDRA